MEQTEQTARIREMEENLNEARAALDLLEEALERYAAAKDRMDALDAYYSSPLWRKDFEDDEAGLLPPVEELPRGVLSEDAAYDVLTDRARLLALMRSLAEENGKPEEEL